MAGSGAGGTGGTGGMTTTTTTSMGGGTPTPTAVGNSGQIAIDSTPDSAAEFIYFTGGKAGDAGIFKVPGNGGMVTDLFVGAPLAGPVGITITSDDKTLFVADPGYDIDIDKGVIGALLSLSTSPSTPAVVMGTEGYKPHGVDIYPAQEGDTLYFTGIDPANGKPGVFTKLAAGGGVSVLAEGAPFVDPSGVAAGKTQTFVTDAVASDAQLARLVVIDNTTKEASTLVDALGLGYPAGVALSQDETVVYLSGVDLATGNDRIYAVDVASKKVTAYGDKDPNIKDNTDAGGLHRARKSEVYSWADLTAGGTGTVYRVELK
jgi:hypothetical protein